MLLIPAFKTLAINSKFRPHSQNELYKMKTRVQCDYCKSKQNRCHVYKTLWSLYMHVTTQHPLESVDFVVNQARILAKGVQK